MDLRQLWNGLADELEPAYRRFRSDLTGIDISTKPDNTILTDADVTIERLIVEHISAIDPNPVIVAEEDGRADVRTEVTERPSRIWIIDPIDGTAEFVKPDGKEFCSVVCLLEDLLPVEAFVFAPEIGRNSTPIVITGSVHKSLIEINGQNGGQRSTRSPWVSVTRSRGERAPQFESELTELGCQLKTGTTSQTLDMVRTAIDIGTLTDPALPSFQGFMRRNQKVWDGLAGLCLGKITGLVAVDAEGRERVPVDLNILRQPKPVFSSTIMGDEEFVTWLLERM